MNQQHCQPNKKLKNNEKFTNTHEERIKEIEKRYNSFEPRKFFDDFDEPKPKNEKIFRELANKTVTLLE